MRDALDRPADRSVLPIAYMSSIPKDIFNPGTDNFSLNSKNWNAYTYATCDEDPDPTD